MDFKSAQDGYGDPRWWTEPQLGNRMDARWGGPTPWEQSLQQYAGMGAPTGTDRPFGRMGKYDATEFLPMSPPTPSAVLRAKEPHFAGPPQPGVFESLIGGMTAFFTDMVPFLNQHNGLIKDAASYVGSLIDFPFKLVRPISFLPGGGDITEMYKSLPTDSLKRKYDEYISQDPINASRYMAEYLNSRGTEVATKMGISPAFQDMFMPSDNIGEQWRRTIFGVLGAGATAASRTYVGLGLRDVDGRILNAADDTLPDELVALKRRYTSGALTRDQFLDELATSRYRWTNDDTPTGALVSFIADVLTDPVTWATLGAASAEKVAATSVRSAELSIARAVESAGRTAEALTWARGAGIATNDVTATAARWAGRAAPDLVEEGLKNITPKQRALYRLEPVITPAAKVADSIQSMFGWMGMSPIARRMSGNITVNFAKGWVGYHGTRNVFSVQRLFSQNDHFTRLMGVAIANEELAMHQGNIARDVMAFADEWRGENGPTPEQVARARMDVNDSIIADGETIAARHAENALPTTRSGSHAVEDARRAFIANLEDDVAAMTGRTVDEARAFLQKANDKELALLHRLAYAQQVINFNDAKRIHIAHTQSLIQDAINAGDTKLADELTQHLQNAQRYTLVSERLLTKDRARTLEAAIRSSDPKAEAIAIDAIEQYDILAANFKGSAMDPGTARQWVHDFVERMLEDNANGKERLAVTVPAGSLDPDIANALSARYEVALRPEDVWGMVMKEDGAVRGVSAFMDAVDDTGPAPFSRNFRRSDIYRSEWFDGIRGARLYYEARERFVKMGVKDYGLTKGDARRLFEQVRAEAMRRNVGARGLKSSDIMAVAHDIHTIQDPGVKARVGERGLLELTVRAWEGELESVGLTTKVSGKMKSAFVQRTDNLLGRIAEDSYIKARFALSPLFLAMETTEGPFFSILHGIKPGWKWSADDIRANSILNYMRTGEKHTDQLERSQLAHIEHAAAVRIAGENTGFSRHWQRFLPEGMQKKGPFINTRVRGLHEFKELLYMRQAAKEAGEEFVRNSKRYAPHVLHQLEMTLGTTNPTKLWVRYMEDRGAFDSSVRHGLHMLDASKPLGLGRREPIRLGDVQNFHGFESLTDMTDAIRNGTYDRSAFIDRYTRLGMDPAYAERAWRMASGWTESEWKAAIRSVHGEGPAADGFIRIHQWLARKKRMSFDEYMNERYAELPNVVDRGDLVPTTAFRQSVRDAFKANDWEYHGVGSAVFERVRARSQALLPRPVEGRPMVQKVDKKGNPRFNADGTPMMGPETGVKATKADVVMNAQRAVEQNPEKFQPPLSKYTEALIKRADETEAEFTARMKEEFDRRLVGIKEAMGTDEAILSAADWYNEVPAMFIGIVQSMPDEVITRIVKHWAKVNPKEFGEAFATSETRVAPGSWVNNKRWNGETSTVDIATLQRIPAGNKLGKTDVNALAEDLRQNGFNEPIQLTYSRADDSWLVGEGNHRLAAAKMAGITDVPVTVFVIRGSHGATEAAIKSADLGVATLKGNADGYIPSQMSALKAGFAEPTSVGKLAKAGDVSLQAAREELAARLNVAFAASQQNTSVADGMRIVGRMLELSMKEGQNIARRRAGKKKAEPMKFGVTGVTQRVGDILKDFDSLTAEGLGPKLMDFIDTLQGKTTRTVSAAMGDTLQPGAMDVWMRRVWGYPDSAYVDTLARERGRLQGLDLSDPDTMNRLRREVRKDRGWSTVKVPKGTPAPTAQEYEWMLRKTNEFTRHLNDVKYLFDERGGREWDAHEAQALLWVAEQARLRKSGAIAPQTDPAATFLHAGQQYAAEALKATKGTDWHIHTDDGRDVYRYPTEETLQQHYPDNWQDIQQAITHDVFSSLVEDISRETGVTITRRIDFTGKWSEAGEPTTFTPNMTTVMWGSEPQMEAAARLIANSLRQNSVFGITRPPDIVLRSTSTKSVVRSDVAAGRYWMLNVAFPEGFSHHEYHRALTAYIENSIIKAGRQAEFPGSMGRLMDDGRYAMSLSWNSDKSPSMLEAIGKANEEIAAAEKAANDILVAEGKKPKKKARRDAGKVSQEEADAHGMLPADVVRALEDGTWVHSFDPKHDPVPVGVSMDMQQSMYLEGDHAKALEHLAVDPAVASRLQEAATRAADAAYARHAPDAFVAHQRNVGLTDPNTVRYQRDSAGAVRAGYLADTGDGRAAVYFVKNATDATTAVHEAFHHFARDLDESAKREFLAAYRVAFPRSGIRDLLPNGDLPVRVEEWVAHEFEAFALDPDLNPNATYHQVFKGFAEWADEAGIKRVSSPHMKKLFDKVLDADRDIPSAFWHADEQRLWEATRLALLRAEEAAHTTHFYRRSRSFVERSLNHPYLGMYPASYMWGKVLPELIRFLVKRPFGLNAPMFGASMATHVWRNIQMQLETDEELRNWVDGHLQTIRFLSLMVPGTPWELPVNLPLIARHYMEKMAEAKMAGKPLDFDPGAELSDMASYAVGWTQLTRRLGDMAKEWNPQAVEESGMAPFWPGS